MIHLFDFIEKYKKRILYIPLIFYWILLFIATSLPGPDVPKLGVSDKVEHFSSYLILAIFLNLTLRFQDKFAWLKRKAASATIVIVMVYAALDELHQLLVPSRDCDIKDWFADSSGAILGVVLVYFAFKYLITKMQKA